MRTLLLLLIANYTLAQDGDCPHQYICTGGSFTAVTGATDELTPPNNGCLAVNEATSSYWFQICALTPGTIQFTISPSGNNNDYDFAVWGGINCPPTIAPIRCSSAISQAGPGGDNTGVNSSNNTSENDNSEGVFGNQWVNDIVAPIGACYTININNYGTGSDDFTLTFGGTATLNCAPLPLEMTTFECRKQENVVVLNWEYFSITNVASIELERGKTSDNFIPIWSAPVSLDRVTYFDRSPIFGLNYYRLKATDMDGSVSYSDMCAIEFDKVLTYNMEFYNLLGQRIKEPPKGIYLIKMTLNGVTQWKKMYKE